MTVCPLSPSERRWSYRLPYNATGFVPLTIALLGQPFHPLVTVDVDGWTAFSKPQTTVASSSSSDILPLTNHCQTRSYEKKMHFAEIRRHGMHNLSPEMEVDSSCLHHVEHSRAVVPKMRSYMLLMCHD